MAAYVHVDNAGTVILFICNARAPHELLARVAFNAVVESAASRKRPLTVGENNKLSWVECAELDEKTWPVLIEHYRILPGKYIL